MGHGCGCQRHRPPAAAEPSDISADRVVGDVVREHPGTLEVMQRLGINHCCGAQLTLREVAGAAGVDLGELLKALRAVQAVPA